jgi:hypothetical protein
MSEELVKKRDDAVAILKDKIQGLKDSATTIRPDTSLTEPPDTASLLQTLVDVHTFEGQGVRHLRRTGSPAAHGYYWSRIQNPNPQVRNEEEFNTSLYGTMMLVKGALELYQARATCCV